MDPLLIFLCFVNDSTTPVLRQFDYCRSLGWEEFRRAREGFVPRSPEDKWLVLHRGGEMSFLRSGDSRLVYRVTFTNLEGAFRATQALVNACPETVTPLPDSCEARILDCLIDRLLLGLPAVFPALPGESPEQSRLTECIWMGRAAAQGLT
jgi:hypothetical protein